MREFMIQVQVGSYFHDMYFTAANATDAIEQARREVSVNPTLKLFRHRFANYVAE